MSTAKFFLHLTMFALMATFILSMASCKGDDPEKPKKPEPPDCTECPDCPGCPPVIVDEFGVSLSEISFSGGKDASLIVVRTKHKWTASASAAWVKLSAASGDGNTGFLVATDANTGFPRAATLTIASNGKTKQLDVTQNGADKIAVTVGSVTFNMIFVEGGTFTTGVVITPIFGEVQDYTYQATLSGFYISETEVTNELWQAITGSLPYSGLPEGYVPEDMNGAKQPVCFVSWNDVNNTFMPAVKQKTGKNFRLPTEHEWEFAARGGVKSKNYTFAGSDNLDDVAWYAMNADLKSHDVAKKQPNELGLYDMSGNVAEWCSDWYDDYMDYHSATHNNPTGPATGTEKVTRGGSFRSQSSWDDNSLETRGRGVGWQNYTNWDLGVRLVMTF